MSGSRLSLPEIKQHWEPGTVAEKFLAKQPEAERLPILAMLEQRAKREMDLEALRELRAYRAKHLP